MLPDIKTIISYALMAPSGHNSQPWKFRTEGHFIKLLPDYSKALPVADADTHELFISIGCVLENLVIAAKQLGYNCNIMYDMTDGAEEILIHLFEDGLTSKDFLFESIPERHVNRSNYLNAEIPEEVLQQLLKTSASDDVNVLTITNSELKHRIALLLKKAAYLQFNRKEYKNELLNWIRFNEKAANEHKDGLRSASMGSPETHPAIGTFFFNHFATPGGEAKKAGLLAEDSPVLVVFAATENSKRNWIDLGRSFERFSLAATRYGIAHAHLNMICEEDELRNELKQLLGLNEEPLLLLRIGYSDKVMPASYRRPVDELVSETL
jgi:nitroreductase